MKKIFAFILVIVFALSLVSCTSEEDYVCASVEERVTMYYYPVRYESETVHTEDVWLSITNVKKVPFSDYADRLSMRDLDSDYYLEGLESFENEGSAYLVSGIIYATDAYDRTYENTFDSLVTGSGKDWHAHHLQIDYDRWVKN